MLRFKDGDEAAFEELVRRNADKIHSLVYRFLGGAAQVEDITQEVFLRIHRTAGNYQPMAKFSTWLYRITANLCFNVMRTRRRTHPVQVSGPGDAEGETFFHSLADNRGESPHAGLAADELRQRVAKAVNALPENQKVAIILNKFEDKSYDEIAEIVGCSAMAVKSLLRRARQNLKRSLAGYMLPR